jgi:iron complex transport system ATP-binding protein
MKAAGSIAAEGISFRYKGGQAALKDLSLNVEAGEIVGVLGPNGAGKSTLARLMNGLLRPRMGRISLDGVDIGEISRKDLALKMAVVHQRQKILFPFTVRETVAMGRWPHLKRMGWMEERDRRAVAEAMVCTGVAELRDRYLEDLSGGERQRTLVARALAQDAGILLLDEPVSHLDVRHQLGILRLLREINREEGRTIFLILHDLNLAAAFCQRLAVISRGELVAEGKPEEVLKPDLLAGIFGVRAQVDRNPLTGSLRVTLGEELPGEGI